ncbi:MAG: serine hydrolase domain-containing protein, partial [Microcystaceae cyanobacterium]
MSKIRLIAGVLGAILGLWLLMGFPCLAEELSPPMLLNHQQLEQFLDGFFAEQMKQQHVPGAALVIVKDGEILLSKGYGYANLEKQTPVSPSQTLWRMGSVSKLLTATAVMQLVEQGKLNLNGDISQYLKDFPIPNTYPQPITGANLLTHTDGFDFGWGIGVLAPSPAELKPLGEFLRSNQRPRLLPPGEIYLYGNVGISLAGYLVEKISGLPFAQYIDTNILQPLNMRQSTFEQPLPPLLAKDLAVGYESENGQFKPRPFAYYQSPPTGAFTATATDMSHFMMAHLQHGRYGEQQILQEATVREMHRQQFTHHPLMPGSAYGFYEHFVNGQRALEHSGRMNGYNSLLMLVPQQNLGVFLAYNNNGGRLIREFTEAFFDRYS